MADVSQLMAVRSALGISLREANDALMRYGSADAAISALKRPAAFQAFISTSDLLIAEKAKTKALLDALRRAKAVIEAAGFPVDTSITNAIAKATREQS